MGQPPPWACISRETEIPIHGLVDFYWHMHISHVCKKWSTCTFDLTFYSFIIIKPIVFFIKFKYPTNFLQALLVNIFFFGEPLSHDSYIFPFWIRCFGWASEYTPFLIVFLVVINQISKMEGSSIKEVNSFKDVHVTYSRFSWNLASLV